VTAEEQEIIDALERRPVSAAAKEEVSLSLGQARHLGEIQIGILQSRLPARVPLVPILLKDLMERGQSQIDLLGGVG
jgi:hypothetical protein